MPEAVLREPAAPLKPPTLLSRLMVNRDWLGFWFMLPAAAFLVLFLAYPLALGIAYSFTDAKIGQDIGSANFIGIENYQWLIGEFDCKWEWAAFWSRLFGGDFGALGALCKIVGDDQFHLAVFNTLFYTIVASVLKFAIGLYLAVLLNNHLPFRAVIRAIVLVPFIVPTVLSAIAFWWIFDPQFSIVSWSAKQMGLATENINFLGEPWNARWSAIFANVWRGVPFIAITLLAGLQTVPPSLYEASTIDGASRWQMFRYITYPLLTPIIAVVMTFSVLFTFTDFQLIKVLTNGGPAGSTELMATLSFNRAILGGQRIGEGAAISTAMIPFLLACILISWFGLQRRKWQQGEAND
ncbi:MAG: sugar ABC transporter permease [Candidatus Odyssella sp.]|nr:sugar ABC transporter permease [Candidatus Odyssella sp.]